MSTSIVDIGFESLSIFLVTKPLIKFYSKNSTVLERVDSIGEKIINKLK